MQPGLEPALRIRALAPGRPLLELAQVVVIDHHLDGEAIGTYLIFGYLYLIPSQVRTVIATGELYRHFAALHARRDR